MSLSREDVELGKTLASSTVGRWWLARIEAEYNTTVATLLYADKQEVEVLRGKARALHEQLKEVASCVNTELK